MTNATRYQCASHHNGGDAACAVALSVPRERVERIILDCVHADLLDPKRLDQLEQRYLDAQRGAVSTFDRGPRLAELDREIRHIIDAIGRGLVSDALAARLKAAEADRARLLVLREKAPAAPRRLRAGTLERRAEHMRSQLAEGGELARGTLLEIFPDLIWLQPDASGRHLWATFADGVGAALLDGVPDYAAMFDPVPSRQVDFNGSGGRI